MVKLPLVIFDIDGTVANLNHRLKHIEGEVKDWDAFYSECDKDLPIRYMTTLFSMVRKYALIGFLTGRPEKYRKQTAQWLKDNHFEDYQFLLMRPNGYNKPDWYFKKRTYLEHIEPRYNVLFVIEDRSQVVKMWREMNILCLQCADGEF